VENWRTGLFQIPTDFDDMVRVCHTIDQESPIFSTVGSSDDVDSIGDELGDYELSYLHNLYQGDIQDAREEEDGDSQNLK
jgi:hypothetical protein